MDEAHYSICLYRHNYERQLAYSRIKNSFLLLLAQGYRTTKGQVHFERVKR